MKLPKIAMLCNIPSPYREGAHSAMNNILKDNYCVFYCAHTEENRLWEIKFKDYQKLFLKRSALQFKGRAIYFNFDIFRELNRYKPDVVITAGFSPTMILAFLWCKFYKKKHLVNTDGTRKSESHLTVLHRFIRRTIYYFTDAFIGVSKGSFDLYKTYNIPDEKIFISPYCADSAYFNSFYGTPKKFDLIFSGQFISRKLPYFFIDVVNTVNKRIPCRVVLIGSGELKESVVSKLEADRIDYEYPGFIQPEQIPHFYASSRVLLFPTESDAWGLVANEACAVGVPVITCDSAGAAHELIIHGHNGFVLPLDADLWAKYIIDLLTNDVLYKRLSDNALESVKKFNYEFAASEILRAVNYSCNFKMQVN